MADAADRPTLPTHGAPTLPSVTVDSYNLELEDADGFIGDKARRAAFVDALDDWRKRHKAASGDDPLGDDKTENLSKKQLDGLLASGSLEAAGIVLSAIEDYAEDLHKVLKRFLKNKAWADTEAIVFGGGFRGSRIGELPCTCCVATLVRGGNSSTSAPSRAGWRQGVAFAFWIPPAPASTRSLRPAAVPASLRA